MADGGRYDNPDAACGRALETAVTGADRSVCAPSLDRRDAATSMPTVPATRETTRAVVIILAPKFLLFASLAIVISLGPHSVAVVGSGCEPTVNDSTTASSPFRRDSIRLTSELAVKALLIVKCAPVDEVDRRVLLHRTTWTTVGLRNPEDGFRPPAFDQTFLRVTFTGLPETGLLDDPDASSRGAAVVIMTIVDSSPAAENTSVAASSTPAPVICPGAGWLKICDFRRTRPGHLHAVVTETS